MSSHKVVLTEYIYVVFIVRFVGEPLTNSVNLYFCFCLYCSARVYIVLV